MTQTGSRVSESGASNESIPNTSSPNEVEVDVDTLKKRKVMEPRANCNGTSSMNTHMRTCPKFLRDTVDKVDNVSSNDATVKEMSKQLSNWGTNIMNGDHLHVRWNFTYSMLDIAQHFELAFERYSFYDIGYLNHLRTFVSDSSEDKDETSVEDGTSVDILTSVDWKNMRGRMRTKQQFEKHKEVSGSSGSKSELERYLAKDIEPDSDDFDILKWWKVNEPRFPILAEMVRDMLAIPISSVASECAFST
ncbi:hypothetical protein KY284_033695 [Solanum tuberosum]|nr:hypothetical protein KY284_033695 [Solanum tuberosum]